MIAGDCVLNSRGGAAVSGPLFDLGQFVDEEDAFALSLPAGLHDPGTGWVLPELLHKEIIIRWQHERHGNKICMKHGANSKSVSLEEDTGVSGPRSCQRPRQIPK